MIFYTILLAIEMYAMIDGEDEVEVNVEEPSIFNYYYSSPAEAGHALRTMAPFELIPEPWRDVPDLTVTADEFFFDPDIYCEEAREISFIFLKDSIEYMGWIMSVIGKVNLDKGLVSITHYDHKCKF